MKHLLIIILLLLSMNSNAKSPIFKTTKLKYKFNTSLLEPKKFIYKNEFKPIKIYPINQYGFIRIYTINF